jgi:hypothetical protein
MSGREAAKKVAHAIAWVLVTPSVLSFAARAMVLGRDRALEDSTQAWALVPGFWGQYLRRAFLQRVLAQLEKELGVTEPEIDVWTDWEGEFTTEPSGVPGLPGITG